MTTRYATTFLLAATIMISTVVSARAQTKDITVNNGQGNSASDYSKITASNTNADPRKGVYDLGYVNSGDVADKSWDLEAFGYNAAPKSQTLTYVGGFDPATKNDGISLGDIFITTGTTKVSLPGNMKANSTVTNPGYTYAIHITNISGSTLTYSIYKLAANTKLETVFYTQNLDSGPYGLDMSSLGNATVIASNLKATVSLETGSQVNSLLNENLFTTSSDQASDSNYVVSFNLTSLDLSAFTASLTEQCGNDELTGAYETPLPEPSSWTMALLVLMALAYLRLARRSESEEPENEASFVEA
ncbi:MAG TPA: hypothetical protein VGC39_11030 [Candidatus Methylacidiphilales bacterium]